MALAPFSWHRQRGSDENFRSGKAQDLNIDTKLETDVKTAATNTQVAGLDEMLPEMAGRDPLSRHIIRPSWNTVCRLSNAVKRDRNGKDWWRGWA